MTRSLLIVTKTEIKRYLLGKDTRPMTRVRRRLYRTDEHLMLKNLAADEEIVVYDVDSTQPYGNEDEYLDPDVTMCMIDIGKGSKSKNVGTLSNLSSMNPQLLLYAIVGVLVVYSLISGGLT